MFYHWEYLEEARQIEDATERPILNPRNVQATSLVEVDRRWRRDLALYRRALKFKQDYKKRPTMMQ